MLAPAALLGLLASLASSPAPCLAQQQQQQPGLPLPPVPLLDTIDFNHAAFWEQLKKDFTPPGEPLRSPYGPQPEPRHPHLAGAAYARRRDAAGRRPPVDLPERPMHLSRLYRPWGDGFVRMPMQRQRLDETKRWRPGPGRPRQPNRPTYPPNAGIQGGLAPNVSTAPLPVTPAAVGDDAAPAKQRRGAPIPARDVLVGNPAAAIADPVPAAESKDKPKGYQDKPGFAWNRLYEAYPGLAYMIGLDIGTPPQRVWVMVDTGSYELWVNPICNRSPDPTLCGKFGRYDPTRSSTVHNMTGSFKAVYGTGEAAGLYYADYVKVASFNVPVVQFAVADDTNYTYSGVLGLGYTYGFTTKYPTLLSMMWALGFVAAPVFSIGLGGEGDGYSEIIFGGVNRWRFTGHLEPIEIWPPIDKQDPTWIQYWVNVTSIGITLPGPQGAAKTYTSSNFVMPMLIDTGSTLSYIREDVVSAVGRQLNATVDSEKTYWVDCKLRQQNGTVDIGFNRGRLVVTISYKDFIWQQTPGKCLMGFQIAEQGSTNYVLGDTFLRGAYLVFDQQVDVVWMADYYNCGDGVQMVGEKPADTQYVVGQC